MNRNMTCEISFCDAEQENEAESSGKEIIDLTERSHSKTLGNISDNDQEL